MSSRSTFASLLASGLLVASTPAFSQTVSELTSVQIVGNVPLRQQIAAIEAVGIKSVRLAVRWNEVEKREGSFDWSMSDRRMGLVEKAGLTPLVTLFGGNNLYRTAEETAAKTPPAQGKALDRFARFSAATVEHYGTQMNGREVLYEIWNEPNTKTFWGLPPNPEAYAAMATAACQAIKQQNAKAKVLGLATEGTPVKTPYFVKAYNIDIYQEWSRRAAKPELMACLDGISMHPYRAQPETYLSDEAAFAAFLKDHWTSPTPPLIANTEWGYGLDQKKGGDETAQASRVLRALLVGVGMKRLTNIYQATDTGTDLDKSIETYGLVDIAGRTKPSGQAVKRLLSLVGDHEVGGVSENGTTAGVYALDLKKDGATARILWAGGTPVYTSSSSLEIKPGSRSINLVTGEETTVEAGDLDITTEPKLIVDPTSRPVDG